MYATLDDLKKRIPEQILIDLTDDQDRGIVDESVIGEVGATVDEVIDGKLRGVYELPLAAVPGIIKAIAIDLRIYEIYSRRPEFVTDQVERRYQNQMKVLEQIRTGVIKLGTGAIDTPTAETPADGVLVSSGDAIFSKGVLDRF